MLNSIHHMTVNIVKRLRYFYIYMYATVATLLWPLYNVTEYGLPTLIYGVMSLVDATSCEK